MKQLLAILFILALLPAALAIDLTVEKTSVDEVMILGLDDPTLVDIEVTNNGLTDDFMFYTFFGVGLEPVERINILEGETKEIQLKILPSPDSKIKGYAVFDYFIQARDTSEITEQLIVNLINLDQAFEIGAGDVDPESNTVQFYLQNKVNFDFPNLSVEVNSAFFNLEQEISLAPNQRKYFELNLNKEDYNKLMAGFYTLKAEITAEQTKANIEGKIKFLEKDILTTEKKERGGIINKKVISKENKGNVVVETQTIMKKNILSRLFTSFSPVPTEIQREGSTIYYTWDQAINPGESADITVKTNWLWPILIILLIIIILFLTKKILSTNIVLRKRVSFVKAKGGEFALKVTLIAEAKQFVEKVRIVDRLPPLVKMYERFGMEEPSKIDKVRKTIEWDFDHLEAGEKRVMSYIIYSKVGILGRFALPSATAIFQKDNKIKDVSSNRAFFLAEARKDF